MPTKTKPYPWIKFSAETIVAARATYDRYGTGGDHDQPWRNVTLASGESWRLDTDDEFLAEYRSQSVASADYRWRGFIVDYHARWLYSPNTDVGATLPERAQVEEVFAVFEAGAEGGRIAAPRPDPVVFIGHGHSEDWIRLRDFLRERAGFRVRAFESRPTAGRAAFEVLVEAAHESSVAILVHTAEDETASGSMRARQNVLHETGFFQAHFGFERAVIVREHGTEEFSNVAGIQEIRYPGGHVSEVFGEVVAVLEREFPGRTRRVD